MMSNSSWSMEKQPSKKAKNRGSKNTLCLLIILVLTALSSAASPFHPPLALAAGGDISTVAGGGSAAGDSGPATSAGFNRSTSVAIDKAGNLYIVNADNHRIHKVDATTKDISLVAGTGTLGFSGDGGLATSAQLNYPKDVVVDKDGNLYIADTNNHRIRKVDATTQNISTYAGTGAAGFSGDGGLAANAQLNYPRGMVIDSSGNLYIADTDNNRIRKVDATTQNISTYAGTGTLGFSGDGGLATSAQLNKPYGVAIDKGGNLFISDSKNNRIRKVDATSKKITTVAGTGTAGFSGDDGLATSAQLNDPLGVAVDSGGNLYIAEYGNHRVRKVTSGGIISTYAGTGTASFSGDGGASSNATLDNPYGVAVDSSDNLYIAEYGNNRIRKVTDTNPPTVSSITRATGVTNLTNATKVDFTVTFSENVTGVDTSDFTPHVTGVTGATVSSVTGSGSCSPSCTVSVTTGNGDGSLSVDVNAAGTGIQDSASNALASGFTNGETYTVDKTPPAAPTVSGPTPTNNTQPTWTWTGDSTGGNGTFRYKLDSSDLTSGATESTIASFTPATAQSDGSHTLYVQERDAAGNWSTSGSKEIVVDTTAPDTTIGGTKPVNPSNDVAPSFTFTSDDPQATFECQLDAGGWATCTTPKALSGLADGSHTFEVRAIDKAGNTDATPDKYAWNVTAQAATTTAIANQTATGVAQAATAKALETAVAQQATAAQATGVAQAATANTLETAVAQQATAAQATEIAQAATAKALETQAVAQVTTANVLETGVAQQATAAQATGIAQAATAKALATQAAAAQNGVVAQAATDAANQTATAIAQPAVTPTPTATNTSTVMSFPTATSTNTPTPTATATPAATATNTTSSTSTATPTSTPAAIPTSIPVVESTNDGGWSEPSTWSGGKVPQGEVVVKTKHKITVDTSINVRELSNEGTLTIAKVGGGPINVSQLLTNKGRIEGEKGSSSGSVDSRKGTSIIVNCDSFQNEGSIVAGSATNGNGGDITITYKKSGAVKGTLTSGTGAGKGTKGGNLSFSISPASALAQQSSGSLVIEGNLQGGAGENGGGIEILANQVEIKAAGEIASGSGTNTSPSGSISIRSTGVFTSKGNVTIPSSAKLTNTLALQSSVGSTTPLLRVVADSIDLQDSRIKVAGDVHFISLASGNQATGRISFAGKNTVIEATNLEVSAGPGATLNLDGLAPGAIKVTNELTFAAGTGGSISMQGAMGVISATKVTLAADKVETGGVALKTIAGANITQLPAQVLSHVSFGQSQSLQTASGQSVTVTVKLYNDSPDQHAYIFTLGLSNSAWKVTGLPSTQTIKSFAAADLQMLLTPPLTATVGETTAITLTTQAKEDAKLGASTTFDVTLVTLSDLPGVYTPTNPTKLYLPLVSKP